MTRRYLRLGTLAVLALLAFEPAGAVGFQELTVPDADAPPLRFAVWYPSDASPTPRRLGLFTQSVAQDGPIAGSLLPLVVISHGAGGHGDLHYDTALALAEAGFVVAAVTHTGDNWRDHSYSFTQRNLVERPRQLKLALDYLLTTWAGHAHIAAGRVGAFGHSAGGYTVLIASGGNPDLSLLTAFCREHPDDWGCQRGRERAGSAGTSAPLPPVWIHDARLKAAVIAAPAMGYAFSREGLASVTAPLQLWQAEDDRIASDRWNAEAVLAIAPETHIVPLAGHFAFLAPCSEALAALVAEICQDPPGFDRAGFHAEFNRAVVAFFQRHLPAQYPGQIGLLRFSFRRPGL